MGNRRRMIVIATNNGRDYLPLLLESIERYTPGEKVLVVDTQSSEPTETACHQITTPYRGYSIGAFIYALEQTDEPEYMFMQDSMLAKDALWLNRFRDKDTGGIVAHSLFPYSYDNPEQREYVESVLPTHQELPWGVFGPIFYARRPALDAIAKTGIFTNVPSNGNQAHGWERIMGGIATILHLPLTSVYGVFDHDLVASDGCVGLQKYFLLRP